MKKFLTSFIITFILALGIAYYAFANPPQANNDFKIHMAQASRAFVTKDYNTAIVNFEKAIAANPNNYEAYCALGMSYGYIGKLQKAEETLLLATKKFPNEWMAYTFLGDIKHQQKHTPMAIEYYKKALNAPTLPQDKKAGMQSIVQQLINEQNAYEAKASVPSGKKISVNLNESIWEEAYFKGTDKQWMIEYGLKGEDVLNYKWTKLVTVNFYDKNAYNLTTEKLYGGFYELLAKSAHDLNSTLSFQKLTSPANEIYFEWSIAGRNESEICRIFKGSKGLYFGHYAHKKPSFSAQEKANAINILKSIKEL